ncbi:porin family protein [Flavobacterium sp.]|uniref:porin family protein n=1 Tax=Flavobacterium sp. TaxID=239 RepID=UPI002633F127|nr:porin family protein [Flavobacterium sp.]
MKKIILSLVAIAAFGVANAQEDMKFGAKAGINMSNFTGDADTDSKIGFQVGAFAEFKVSEKFAVQPEILFSALGAKDDSDNYNSNYILVPVMAKYYVAEGFSLEAGPQIGFLMSAKYGDTDIKDAYKSTDFALNLGAGYDVAENINIGLRYSLGLSNVSDIGGDVKTSNIALAVGYKF